MTSSAGPFIAALKRLTSERGVQAFVVGGAVRDRLLGRAASDVDVSVDVPALPFSEELGSRLGVRLVVIDSERRYARLVSPAGWQADLTSHGDSLEADLARRDFTINAMAVPVDQWPAGAESSLIDPAGGKRDLESRVIRRVSGRSLTEDPVRLLRAVRLASQLEFDLEPGTAQAVKADAARLSGSAVERVREELYAIFATNAAERGVELLDGLGLLDQVLPEVGEGRGVSQPRNHHYWDVFTHCVRTVGKADQVLEWAQREPPEAPWRPDLDGHFDEVVADGQSRRTLLRLGGLLHDVGKPRCKSIQADGRIRFFGHHEVGAEMVEEMLGRLRCSRRTITHIRTMVRHHLRPMQLSQGEEAPSGRAVFRYFRDLESVAVDTAYLNMADYLAARGPELQREDWLRYAGIIDAILAGGFDAPQQSKPFLLLDGTAVMGEFGLRPGPRVGRLLSALKDAETRGIVQTRDEAIEYLRRLEQ